MITVLVDAANVRRSLWPNIPPDELVELCRSWAEDRDVRAVVVFDGEAPGGLVGERELDARTELVGTGPESADDWLIANASARAPYWLVTSDRALRSIAGRDAERTIGGGSFARELRAGGHLL
ncbi:MAG: hypothetical protein ACRDN6_06645 [Gaiellaceae bacterium]